jgi:hypothetical protein
MQPASKWRHNAPVEGVSRDMTQQYSWSQRKILGVILVGIWVLVSVLRSVARRRPVETKNPSACATVNCQVWKSAIALYCLYLIVIKRECVTKVLINPIIRTRTRHFVTHTVLHVTVLMTIFTWSWLYLQIFIAYRMYHIFSPVSIEWFVLGLVNLSKTQIHWQDRGIR